MKSLLTFFTAIVTILSPGIQTTGTPPVDTFITLAESTTFGPGGSIFDYSTRVSPPVEIIPPDAPFSDYSTVDTTTFKDAGCSADETTQNAIEELLDGDGTGDAANSTVYYLPDDCKVKWHVTATTGSSTPELTIGDSIDDVALYCADPTVCGFEVVFRSMPQSGTEIGPSAFHVGANRDTSPLASCDWDDTYKTEVAFGSRLVKVKSSDCSIAISGGSAWGPGDVVRITTARITGFGQNIPTWLTRVTCVSDASNNRSPASGDPSYATLCSEITGANQIQLEDPLPMDFRDDAYYWGGAGVGTNFDKYVPGSGTPDPSGPTAYAVTSGHEIHQIERVGSLRCGLVAPGVCGNGTETNNISEDVWFVGIGWDMEHEFVGSQYVRFTNAFGGGLYKGRVDGNAGRPSAFTFGGDGKEAGRIAMHSMDWRATGHNSKYFGEILSITKTNPVTVTVAVASSAGWGEPMVGISQGANSDLAGKTFLVSSGTYTAGSPNTRVMTLTGLDGTAGTGIDIDTTPGGYMTNIDRYGGASFYANPYTSNIQIVNNFFINPLQHAIYQGCTGCVYAANYVRSIADEAVHGRGPFYHGNMGASGDLFEMNDQDHRFVLLASSNGESLRHAEGVNHVFYKNRTVDSGATTWPEGSTTSSEYYSASGLQFHLEATSQNGASNERWGFLLNVGKTQGSNLDNCDNYTGDGGANCSLAHSDSNKYKPHLLYDLASHRNRCYGSGCNLDTMFVGATNPTTDTDVFSDENGDNSNAGATAVPGAWSGEIGDEPTSLFFTGTPFFWCTQSGTFGEFGAYYDDFTGTLSKLPAQIRYEGTTCTPP